MCFSNYKWYKTEFVRIVKYVITNLFMRSNSVLKVAREVSEDATEQPKDAGAHEDLWDEDVHEPQNLHDHIEIEQH